MNALLSKILALVLAVCTVSGYAQRTADLGIRLNNSDYNRIQFEFRKPVFEKSYLRIGASLGDHSWYPGTKVVKVEDSVVTMRQRDQRGNYYDLRFGFEKGVGYEWLSFHADAIAGYQINRRQNWSYYYVLDSTGTNWNSQYTHPSTGLDDATAIATTNYFNAGLALGLSFNFPVTENFILNFMGNYTGIMRFSISETESNDQYNEFNFTKTYAFDLYPNIGVGLRFMFGSQPPETSTGN